MARDDALSVPSSKQFRHQKPLEDDLATTGPLRTKSRKRKAHRGDDPGDSFVDSKASRKILRIGQELAEEDQQASQPQISNTAFTFESRYVANDSENVSDHDDGEAWGDEDDEVVEDVVCISFESKLTCRTDQLPNRN